MVKSLNELTIFVGGLISTTTEQDLLNMFRQFGEITKVKVIRKKNTKIKIATWTPWQLEHPHNPWSKHARTHNANIAPKESRGPHAQRRHCTNESRGAHAQRTCRCWRARVCGFLCKSTTGGMCVLVVKVRHIYGSKRAYLINRCYSYWHVSVCICIRKTSLVW